MRFDFLLNSRTKAAYKYDTITKPIYTLMLISLDFEAIIGSVKISMPSPMATYYFRIRVKN